MTENCFKPTIAVGIEQEEEIFNLSFETAAAVKEWFRTYLLPNRYGIDTSAWSTDLFGKEEWTTLTDDKGAIIFLPDHGLTLRAIYDPVACADGGGGGGDQGGGGGGSGVKFTADQTALVMQGVDAGCDACDNELAEVFLRLIGSIERIIVDNDKEIQRLKKKITRLVNRQQATCGNLIEKVTTNINNYVNNEAYTCAVLLSDLRDKALKCRPCSPVTQQQTGPSQIVIDLKPLLECCAAIVEALREIRDRLPGVPVEYPEFEEESKEAEKQPEVVLHYPKEKDAGVMVYSDQGGDQGGAAVAGDPKAYLDTA